MLINKQHPIPEGYEFKLGTIKDSMQCDERIIDDLLLMMHGAKKDGVNLVIKSPYRTLDRQEFLFNKKIKHYMGQGLCLAEHSCEYGFTLRYPLGKEYITSIEYEPWHFRYVGREAATIMKEEDICLEEFWDKYL